MRKCQGIRSWGKGERLGDVRWWCDFLLFSGRAWHKGSWLEENTWRVLCVRHCGETTDWWSPLLAFSTELWKKEVRVLYPSGTDSWSSEQRCGPSLRWGLPLGRGCHRHCSGVPGALVGSPQDDRTAAFHSLLPCSSHKLNSNHPRENRASVNTGFVVCKWVLSTTLKERQGA